MWLKKFTWCSTLRRLLTVGSFAVIVATLAILPFVTEKRVRYSACRVHPSAHDPNRFTHDNSESPFSHEIVPNTIHFYRTGNDVNQFTFIDAVCLLSAFRFGKPDKIIIHTEDVLSVTECLSKSIYGKCLMELAGFKDVIDVQYWPSPKHVFGIEFSNLYRSKHTSDITRLRILRKYGGIFLDNRALLLRDTKLLRYYEMTALFNDDGAIGNNLLSAHRDSRLLDLWLKSYHAYNPNVSDHHHSNQVMSLLKEKTTFYHSFPNSVQDASVDMLFGGDNLGLSIRISCYVVEVTDTERGVALELDKYSPYTSDEVISLVDNLYNRYN